MKARPGKAPQRAVALAAAVTALAVGCSPTPDDLLPGTVERDRVEVSAENNEPIVERRVREGQSVARGDILIVQDTALARSRIEAAQADSGLRQAQLSERIAGARAEDKAMSQARVERARVQLQVETRELQRLQGLVAEKLISESQLVRQQGARDSAAAILREAEADLRELQRGTRPEQIAQARQSLEQARARERELATTAGRLTVVAPVDGTVDALPYQVGERPSPGAPVAVLLANGSPFVRAYLPEPRRTAVRVGGRARIRVDGVAESFAGAVRYVASEAAYTPYYSLTAADRSRLAFRLEVTVLGDAARNLPSGVPATVELLLP
jgi:HlyD family secretion protein